MLWLAIRLAKLSLEALTRGCSSTAPLVVVSGQESGARVVACDRQAEGLGVAPGMTLPAVLAIAPTSWIRVRNTAREQAALAGIACWATQITPSVSLQPPRGLLLEVGGSLRLFGGLNALIERVRRGLGELGYDAELACAPTPLGAMLLSRCAGQTLMPIDCLELGRYLDALPVDCLELNAETLGTLNDIGVRTLEECRRLPRYGLARRCGPELLATLDKAYGRIADPRKLFVPPPRFESILELADETRESAALLFGCRRLLVELAGFLAGRDGGSPRLRFTLHHPKQPPTPVTLALVEPSRDPHHLTRLLRERLANLTLPVPVRAIGLVVDEIQPLAPESQTLLQDRDHATENPARLLERLRARLGPAAAQGIRIVSDHRPELAWQPRADCNTEATATTAPMTARPLWLLAQPCSLETVSGRPWLDGGPLHLRDGPERIETGWWDSRGVTRDYYVAESGGARFWIFHDRKDSFRWCLHGIFA
jgi:protein ImuB